MQLSPDIPQGTVNNVYYTLTTPILIVINIPVVVDVVVVVVVVLVVVALPAVQTPSTQKLYCAQIPRFS